MPTAGQEEYAFAGPKPPKATDKGGGLGTVHKAFNSVQMQLTKFTTCTPTLVQAIVDACVQVHFARGDYIVTMGERAAGLFFIIEGVAAVCVPSLQIDGIDVMGEMNAGGARAHLALIEAPLAAEAVRHAHAQPAERGDQARLRDAKAYISPISRLYLAHISPRSRLHLG